MNSSVRFLRISVMHAFRSGLNHRKIFGDACPSVRAGWCIRQSWWMLYIWDRKAPATQESNTGLIAGFSPETLAIKEARCKTEALSAHTVCLWALSGRIICGPNSSQCRFPSWKSSHCGEIVWVFICLLDLELLEVF